MKFILLCTVMASVSLGQSSESSTKLNHNTGTFSNCKCGSRNSGRIVGGKKTGRNEYPWMVALESGARMCGGSIITQYHVLTAAQCTNAFEPYQITVFVGRHNIQNPYEGVQYSVARIMEHKNYTTNSPVNDISILVTRREIKFNQYVSPICLPGKRFDLAGKEMKAIGWGKTEGTGDRNILHEVDLEFVSLDKCQQFYQYINLKETFICAYGYRKDTCKGDSGGPLVYLNPDNSRYTQVALSSFGDVSCKGTIPSVNIEVFPFMDWINEVISMTTRETWTIGVKACTGIQAFIKIDIL